MLEIARTVFVLLVLCGSTGPAGQQGHGESATPADEYQALVTESEQAKEALATAASADERQAAAQRVRALPARFLELAEEFPDDPVAVDALIQVVALANGTAFPTGAEDSPGYRALELLRRNHADSDKLGRTCQHVVFGFHRSHELFLRAVLEANRHHEVRALARLSLAQFLSNRLDRLDILRDQDGPELAERYYSVFGRDDVEELLRQDRSHVAQEAERLFAEAEEYDDIEVPVTYYGSGGTVGETARTALYQLRFLAVGKTAPEIEGQDQDGFPFRLSDYRGRVVLLDFWHRL